MLKHYIYQLAIATIILSPLINQISSVSAQVPIETTSDSPREVILTRPSSKPDSSRPSTESVTSAQRFSCQYQNGQYTVMYQPKSQAGQYFPWAVPSVMGGGWSSDRRCNEISRRLEQYRPDGLIEMRTSSENGYNTVCATTEKNNACRIILTVPRGADPNSVRDRVFANLATADSGQTTTGVNTYVAGDRPSFLGGLLGQQSVRSNSYRSDGIYLKPYLDPADGGTGTELGISNNSSEPLRFKPNSF